MRLTVVPAVFFLFSLLDQHRSLYLGRARHFCKQFVYRAKKTTYAYNLSLAHPLQHPSGRFLQVVEKMS